MRPSPKHEANSKRSLSRLQFIDALFTISTAKYYNTGIEKTVDGAFNKLITCNIVPFADQHDTISFRKKFCLIESADRFCRQNSAQIDGLFKKFSGELCLPDEPKTMSPSEWMALCDQGFYGFGVGERSLKLAFCRSRAVSPDLFVENYTYKKLSRVEFCEGLLRIAHASLEAQRDGVDVDFTNGDDDTNDETDKTETDVIEAARRSFAAQELDLFSKRGEDQETIISALAVCQRAEVMIKTAATRLNKKKKKPSKENKENNKDSHANSLDPGAGSATASLLRGRKQSVMQRRSSIASVAKAALNKNK